MFGGMFGGAESAKDTTDREVLEDDAPADSIGEEGVEMANVDVVIEGGPGSKPSKIGVKDAAKEGEADAVPAPAAAMPGAAAAPPRKSTEMWTGEDADTLNLQMMVDENLPEWFTSGLAKMDKDGDGELHRAEVTHWVDAAIRMKDAKEANSPDIDYRDFPDQVKQVLVRWDTDANGKVSVSELAGAAAAQKKMEQENRYMKIAVMALGCIIILLALLNFAMGYAAVEAGKDYRPADADHSRRRLLSEEEESVYGVRLLHAEGDDSSTLKNEPGTFMDDDVTMSTAMCTNLLKGMGEVMEVLTTINPKSAGRLQTLTVPTSTGQKVFSFGVATVTDRLSLVDGAVREFSQEGGGPTLRLIAPPMPQWNATDPCMMYPERRMEFEDGASGMVDVVTEYFLSHNGCPPPGGPPIPYNNPQCAPPAPLFNGTMPANEACVPTLPTLVVQCEAQKPPPVGMGQMPELHSYCPAGRCNATEFVSFYNLLPVKPGNRPAAEVFTMWDKNNDTIVDESEIMRGQNQAAPEFSDAQNSLMTQSPTVETYVTHAMTQANKTTRRLMEAELLAGTFSVSRRRVLLGVDANGEKKTIVRALYDRPTWRPEPNATRIRDVAVRVAQVSNVHAARTVDADRLADGLCEAREALCDSAPAMTRQCDKDGDGRITEREYEAIHEKASADPRARNRPDVEPEPRESDVCPHFANPDLARDGVDCATDLSRKLQPMADQKAFCVRAAGRDGILDNEECKAAGRVPTTFDKLAELQAGGDPRMKAMVETSGVGLPTCKQYYQREKSLDEPVAEVLCWMRDFEQPYMTERGGLSSTEANMGFQQLLERYGQVGASASATVRRLRAEMGYGKRTRDKFGNIVIQESALAKQHETDDPLHHHVFEKLVNIPRARRMEAKIVKQERKLRMKRRNLLGREGYDEWILARRLKSAEKLRRRRMLLAFNPEMDDVEETHRKLQRVNRRLQMIAEAAHDEQNTAEDDKTSRLRKLEAAGRRLLEEDDEQDRELRYLLDDDQHTVSGNIHTYKQQFGVGATSKHMRELMALTHAGKRNLVSLEQIGDAVQKYLFAEDTVDQYKHQIVRSRKQTAKKQKDTHEQGAIATQDGFTQSQL
eukprot:CAMPEP_0178991058 /NCGR_PEP_ID=MMETSP0795-20121207/5310_1 /TAXON_ID=88552 /ORGANISM="Amoebophrya sp., Strain Ameob2" /LENGTH=1109 /DNA_ID=CAMNT_0020682711 /DNA_START=531 /DNA_END=3864 /DNA_ORIENTATION=-